MANFKEDILQITTRLIVEEGFDYAHAKQKAGSMLAPNKRRKTKFNSFPTNLEIEKSVKNYLEMFYWEDLNLRIDILQEKAKNLMVELEDFAPILIGELSKDIATEYTIVQLCVFSDSSKDILIHFLDMNHSTEILQLKHPLCKGSVEALACEWEEHDAIIYCLKNKGKNLCSGGVSLNAIRKKIQNRVKGN